MTRRTYVVVTTTTGRATHARDTDKLTWCGRTIATTLRTPPDDPNVSAATNAARCRPTCRTCANAIHPQAVRVNA